MERPWKFYNDMCVRTFVKQADLLTGRRFKNETYNEQLHSALSDCRHQIKYLVSARKALMPKQRRTMLLSPEVSFSSAGADADIDADAEEALLEAAAQLLEENPSQGRNTRRNVSNDVPRTAGSPSKRNERSPCTNAQAQSSAQTPSNPAPKQLLTPETSFSAEDSERE